MDLKLPNKNVFFNNYILDVFLFVTAIISLLATTIVINILCKHKKLQTLVASLVLQEINEVGVVVTLEKIKTVQSIEYTCKIQWYTVLMLSISILGFILFVIIKSRNLKLFRGHSFSNTVKIMLFILDTKYYVPIKLCKMIGRIHLLKIYRNINFRGCQIKKK